MISILKKINFLITKGQREGLVVLAFLLFIGMIFEIFGLGILIPALSILLDPEMIETNSLVSILRSFFLEYSNQNFLFIILGSIVAIYFFKSLFLVFLTHKQNLLLNNITAYISNSLFESYMCQPYSYHLDKNSADLVKNVQIEVHYFYTFLLSLITAFIELGFVVSVIATLIYIEPVGAVSIGLFFGFLSFLFFQFTKNRIKKWGEVRHEIDSQISKIATETLGSIKYLLIAGKTSFFTKKYISKNILKAKINSNQGTISQTPRFFLEFISIVGLVCFIILLILQGKDSNRLFTSLGVFVAATFRIIPSLNRIISSTQSMKYFMPSVDTIYGEVKNSINYKNSKNSYIKKFDFNQSILFKNVNFSYNSNELLKNINLFIKKGQVIGIVGESGSGKSTLIDLLMGLHDPKSGDILIDGVSGFQTSQEWRNIIGYVPQNIYLVDDSILNNIAFGINEESINLSRVNDLIKQLKLEKLVNSLEFGLNTKIGEKGIQLSGGQIQRIGIARALYNYPQILIFDEATSALDSNTEFNIIDSIYSLKGDKTIVMIAHRISTLSRCDFIFNIDKSLN